MCYFKNKSGYCVDEKLLLLWYQGCSVCKFLFRYSALKMRDIDANFLNDKDGQNKNSTILILYLRVALLIDANWDAT